MLRVRSPVVEIQQFDAILGARLPKYCRHISQHQEMRCVLQGFAQLSWTASGAAREGSPRVAKLIFLHNVSQTSFLSLALVEDGTVLLAPEGRL